METVKRKDKIQLAIIWGLALVMGLALFIAFEIYTRPQHTGAQSIQVLDCQYPTRPLVDGQCDNSDPCDPTTIKDPVLHGDCATSEKDPVNDLPDPDRDYYDGNGNRYNYKGELQELAPTEVEQAEYVGK